MILGLLLRRKPVVNYLRLQFRSSKKVSDDLDILQIIKNQRQHSAAIYGLITKQQRKFTESFQFELLSEFSTPDEDISHNKTTSPNSNSVNVKLESSVILDYLDTMIYHSTEKDLRYLELYEKKDDKRLRNWLSSDPKNLLEMNVKRFKLLLALNLSKRAERHGK